MEEEVWQLDATAQAALVQSGAVGNIDLVLAALARAEEAAELHTTTALFADRAIRRATETSGPFAGVPILLKDAGQELAGTPMWMGSRILKEAGYTSTVTTKLALQLEALGFIVIGKAAVPELMTGITTEPPIGGPTGNPWAKDQTVGGSSGGSAAAVAAGIVPVAHGSDSTGSLRYPASCCGVLTLKPSAGRISSRLPAGIANPGNTHTDFLLARSARDLQTTFASLATSPTTDMRTIGRVGVLNAMPFDLSIDPAVDQALADVATELVEFGIEIDYLSPDFLEVYGTVLAKAIPTIVDAHRAAVVDWIETQINRVVTTRDLSVSIIEAAERGRHIEPQALNDAREALRNAAQTATSWADRFDALLLPILDVLPWHNGTPGSDGLLGGLICSLANFSGQPSIPIPTVHKGLPVGVQLQAATGHDEALIDLLQTIRPTSPPSPHLSA